VLAVGAGEDQLRGGLVDVHDKVEVLHAHFAGAAAAAEGHSAGIRLTPGPGEQLDLVLVLGVKAFAGDAIDFQKIINCHRISP
jgi:hypothetical protein